MARDIALVMPKLGLTMTEGMVSEWIKTSGQSFDANETIALIETDKIAYELAAPGAGALSDILVPTGTMVPVGTPIAAWVPEDDSSTANGVETRVAQAAPAPAAAVTASPALTAAPGPRLIATPLARRMAREAGIALATVPASNGYRIRATDVRAAAAALPPPTPNEPTTTAIIAAEAEQSTAAQWFSFYEADVDVGRLLRLLDELDAALPELRPAPVHFVVLAAARALAEQNIAPRISFQRAEAAPCVLEPAACQRLSTIIACGHSAELAGPALEVIDAAGVTKVARMPSPPCVASLGVGTVSHVMRPSAQDAPAAHAELTLTLCLGQGGEALQAERLLARIRSLLDNPFALLTM